MQRSLWNAVGVLGFALFLVLAVAAVLPGHVQAASGTCLVKDVTVYNNRVHVRCTAAVKDGSANIFFFAVSTSNAVWADRFLSAGMTALASGRRFIFHYTAGDTSGAAFDCLARDCRKAIAFGIE